MHLPCCITLLVEGGPRDRPLLLCYIWINRGDHMAQIARMPWYYRLFKTLGLVEAQELRQLQKVE